MTYDGENTLNRINTVRRMFISLRHTEVVFCKMFSYVQQILFKCNFYHQILCAVGVKTYLTSINNIANCLVRNCLSVYHILCVF